MKKRLMLITLCSISIHTPQAESSPQMHGHRGTGGGKTHVSAPRGSHMTSGSRPSSSIGRTKSISSQRPIGPRSTQSGRTVRPISQGPRGPRRTGVITTGPRGSRRAGIITTGPRRGIGRRAVVVQGPRGVRRGAVITRGPRGYRRAVIVGRPRRVRRRAVITRGPRGIGRRAVVVRGPRGFRRGPVIARGRWTRAGRIGGRWHGNWLTYGWLRYPGYWQTGLALDLGILNFVYGHQYYSALDRIESRIYDLERRINTIDVLALEDQVNQILWLLEDLRLIIEEQGNLPLSDQDAVINRIMVLQERAQALLS